tara:strand:+ start:310 stop:1035 length:726 start_codon:yes stop_codon:yes gene_type:complete
MKKLLHYSLAIAVTLLTYTNSSAQFKKVRGSGNVTTKTHSTSDYHKVDLVGFMDVKLEKGTEGTITVKTDDNIHEYVSIESNKGVLKIKIKNNIHISTKKGLYITVPFSDLDNVSLTGSGDVLTSSQIKSDQFEAELTGSGDMILDVDSNIIDAKVTGSGDLKIIGSTTHLEIKVIGSGDFDGDSLNSQNVQAYVSGSGNARVVAKNSIKARINGSGDINYSGNPGTSDTKVMGSGDISSN